MIHPGASLLCPPCDHCPEVAPGGATIRIGEDKNVLVLGRLTLCDLVVPPCTKICQSWV